MGTRAREVEKFSILSSPGSGTASRALSTLVLDPSDATGPFGVVAELRSREGVNSTVNCTVFGRPHAEAQARGTRTETSVASEQLFPHFVPVRGGMGFERTGERSQRDVIIIGISLVVRRPRLRRATRISRIHTPASTPVRGQATPENPGFRPNVVCPESRPDRPSFRFTSHKGRGCSTPAGSDWPRKQQ